MIFICGHHNTGKTTVANELKKLGFLHIETGNIVRNIYNNLPHNKLGFEDWATEVSKNNLHYFDQCVLENIRSEMEKSENLGNIVITGNRQRTGIDFLIKNIKTPHPNLVLFLTAPVDKLFQRQFERTDRKIPNLTLSTFKNDYLGFDEMMGIEKIREITDHVIDTNRDIQEIMSEIESILEDSGVITAKKYATVKQ